MGMMALKMETATEELLCGRSFVCMHGDQELHPVRSSAVQYSRHITSIGDRASKLGYPDPDKGSERAILGHCTHIPAPVAFDRGILGVTEVEDSVACRQARTRKQSQCLSFHQMLGCKMPRQNAPQPERHCHRPTHRIESAE